MLDILNGQAGKISKLVYNNGEFSSLLFFRNNVECNIDLQLSQEINERILHVCFKNNYHAMIPYE